MIIMLRPLARALGTNSARAAWLAASTASSQRRIISSTETTAGWPNSSLDRLSARARSWSASATSSASNSCRSRAEAITRPIAPTPSSPIFSMGLALSGKLEHAIDRALGLARDFCWHGNLRSERLERANDSIERDGFHERAHRIGIYGVKLLVRVSLVQLVHDSELSSHCKFLSRRFINVAQHSFGGKKKCAVLRQRTIQSLGHARTHTATLGMQQQLDVRMQVHDFDDLFGPNRLVDVAIAGIGDDVAASGLPRNDLREEFVREKQDSPLGGYRADHLRGVRRGAAVVAFSLHRGGGVDVGDHHSIGQLCFPLPQFLGRDRRGKRAAGAQVRQKYDFVRKQNRRRFRHEMHSTEHDYVCIGLRCGLRGLQRVGHCVGNLPNFGPLVMVRKQDGLALRAKAPHPLLLPANFFRGILHNFNPGQLVASFKALLDGSFWHDGSPVSTKL